MDLKFWLNHFPCIAHDYFPSILTKRCKEVKHVSCKWHNNHRILLCFWEIYMDHKCKISLLILFHFVSLFYAQCVLISLIIIGLKVWVHSFNLAKTIKWCKTSQTIISAASVSNHLSAQLYSLKIQWVPSFDPKIITLQQGLFN